jgi:DNA ligase (NAD+)
MGKIYNFIEVMKIKGIGPSTVEDLFHAKIISKIEDLFALKWNKLKIVELDGYGATSANQIIKAMENIKATEAQILGSIGIPGIKTKKAQTIIDQIPLDSIIQNEFQVHIIDKLRQIKGLGEATIDKFVKGVTENIELLRFLVEHIHIKKATEIGVRAVFTGFRNPEFEAHLLKGGIAVDDSITKKTGFVIALNPEQSSGKIKKAKELGIPVISLTEAFERFNFKS